MHRHLVTMLFLLAISSVATAQDYEAIERRLAEAIHDGELTISQAHAMMEALKRSSEHAKFHKKWKHRMETAGREIKEALKAGRLTEQEAKAKWATLERESHMAMAGMNTRAAVARGDLTPEQARAKMKHLHAEHTNKHQSDLASDYRKLGISGAELGRIKKALVEAGIEDKQLEQTLGGLLRAIHLKQSGGVENAPRLQNYLLKEVGLTDEQLEVVEGLAKRKADNLKEQFK